MTKQSDSTRFLEAARHVLSVPKAEIDRRDAKWKKARKQGKKP